jgi:hypothetical protein
MDRLRRKILVTHYVELVLPGAGYLVRMLDGRIDTQGTIRELQAQGVLEYITEKETVRIGKSTFDPKSTDNSKSDDEAAPKKPHDAKQPRKLVQDEYREVGGVKWSVYKTYLQASYVWS